MRFGILMKKYHGYRLWRGVLYTAAICWGSTLFLPKLAAGQSSVVIAWNSAVVNSIRDSNLGAPMAARALAILHTCMYDAWAPYDDRAVGTQLAGALRRPASEQTLENKKKAISYAAYRALADVLPADRESVYKPLM